MRCSIPFAPIFWLLLLPALSDCEKSTPPKTELEKLPPITSTGRFTFGCLVNGEAKVAGNTLDVPASYQFGMLQITGVVGEGTMAIHLYIDDTLIKPVPFTVTFDSFPHTHGVISYITDRGGCYGRTDGSSENTGSITITRFDHSNLIVSGIFNFELKLPGSCGSFTITEGRFDTQFTP